MRERRFWPPQTGAEAFAWAAVLGPFSGIAVTAVGVEINSGDVFRSLLDEYTWGALVLLVPLYWFSLSLFAIPFAGVALLIFGAPVALLLKHKLVGSRWLLVPLLIYTAIISSGWMYLVDRMSWSHWAPFSSGFILAGNCFGIPTALWAWFVYRRVLIRRVVEAGGGASR